MGGAVMFLIAATVGITYGWTPDGGQGVKYIIQIPANQVDQVVRSGEIASQIPTEIRGHVSEVVIRIGEGSLPRITPNHLTRADHRSSQSSDLASRSVAAEQATLAAADRSPMPIPAMRGNVELSPTRNIDSATAMMKPAPQGGGMNLPGSLGLPSTNPMNSPNSMGSAASPLGNSTNSNIRGFDMNLQQTARDTFNNAGNQIRNSATDLYQKTQQGIGQAADQLGRSANSQMQSATGAARDAMSGMISGDDPRSRLGQSNTAARNPNAPNFDVPRPGTEAFGSNNPNNGTNPYARSSVRPSTDPTAAGNFNDPRSNTATGTNSGNSQSEQDWYDLRNGPRNRPSTDPIDTNVASNERENSRNPSLFDNSNFGRLPSGLQPASSQSNDPRMTNARNSSSSANMSSTSGSSRDTFPRETRSRDGYGNSMDFNSSTNSRSGNSANLDYDPRLTASEAQRLPTNGYSFDEQGYPIDRQGYRLNRFGQRTDETLRNNGNPVDDRNRFANGNDFPVGSNLQDINRNNYNPNSDPNQRFTNVGTTNSNPNPNAYPYGNNTQLVQPPLAAGPGQYPVTNAYPPGTYPNPTPSNPYLNPAAVGMGAYPQFTDPRLAGIGGSASEFPNSNQSQIGRNNSTSSGDRSSDLDALNSTSTRHASSIQSPEQVAAQPIFNGMLLLSVVTNAYLLFWLKNLRLQFRDTVAAKRSSAGNNPMAATV